MLTRLGIKGFLYKEILKQNELQRRASEGDVKQSLEMTGENQSITGVA